MKATRFIKRMAIVVVILYLVGFVLINSFTVVPVGYAGVKETLGVVTEKSYPNGPVWHWPFIGKVDTLRVWQNIYVDTVNIKTADSQDASIPCTINYQLVKDNVHTLYLNVGKGYQEVLLQPLFRNAVTQTLGKRSAIFISAEYAMIQEAILYIIKDRLQNNSFVMVNDVNIYAAKFSKDFQKAIENKEIAKLETERVKEEANQMLIMMQARAEGLKLKGEALKNPLIIQYEYAKAMENWDGALPGTVVNGGNTNTLMPLAPYAPLTGSSKK